MIKQKMMDELFTKREKIHAEATKVDKAIKALQDICEHDLANDGHDSHKDHYKCTICRYTESW
jgi:hypothetical protein